MSEVRKIEVGDEREEEAETSEEEKKEGLGEIPCLYPVFCYVHRFFKLDASKLHQNALLEF